MSKITRRKGAAQQKNRLKVNRQTGDSVPRGMGGADCGGKCRFPPQGLLCSDPTRAPLYPPHVGAGFPLHTLPRPEAPAFPQSPLPESALHPSQVSPPSPHSCGIFLQNLWMKNLLKIPYIYMVLTDIYILSCII